MRCLLTATDGLRATYHKSMWGVRSTLFGCKSPSEKVAAETALHFATEQAGGESVAGFRLVAAEADHPVQRGTIMKYTTLVAIGLLTVSSAAVAQDQVDIEEWARVHMGTEAQSGQVMMTPLASPVIDSDGNVIIGVKALECTGGVKVVCSDTGWWKCCANGGYCDSSGMPTCN